MESRLVEQIEDLEAELQSILYYRRSKLITKAAYDRQKKKLKVQLERLEERLADLKAKAKAKAKAEAEREKRKALALAKQNQKVRSSTQVRFEGTNERGESGITTLLFKAWAATKGLDTLIAIIDNNTTTKNVGNPADMSSQAFMQQFIQYSYGGGYSWIIRKRLTLLAPTQIPAERLIQAYRDGIGHCVFTPIFLKLAKAFDESENKDVKKRINQRFKKLKGLELLYKKGVPEDKMEEVAKASGFKIVLHDILGNEIKVYNQNQKKVLRFTNTRENHLDTGHLTLDTESDKVSQEAVNDLLKKVNREKSFYLIEGDLKNGLPRKIRTLDECVEVFDPNKEYYDSLNEKIDLNKYKLNATKYPDVNKFIKAGRIINSWATPFSDEKPTGHLDMPKAYTQFKKCSNYSGFLGVIHQFRSGEFSREWIKENIGIYRFEVIGFTGNVELYKKLGLSIGSIHILPSVEIDYFIENGVSVKITEGVWGSRMDFEFPDEMLEDRRYAYWSGRLSMERTHKSFTFKSNKRWAGHLKSEFGDDCLYWEGSELCTVKVPNKQIFTTHHILAFITSYVRIQMMESMKKFKIEQICKVVLDGIYFTGEKPMGLEWFKQKDLDKNHSAGFGWYDFSDDVDVDWKPTRIKRNTLLTGQGGAGKTYSVLTDNGFNKILFVSPQHTLGADIAKNYKIPYTTIHKLLGKGYENDKCRMWKDDHFYPSVIFIDEITQIPADWIDEVFKQYPESLVILAGDLTSSGMWFQTRNGKPGGFSTIWKPHSVDIINVEGDRRSRDDELKELKLKVREEMQRVFINGDSGEDKAMITWAKKNLAVKPFFDAMSTFQEGDNCIAGTHRTSMVLLSMGITTGWYKKGGFVSYTEMEGYEKRGSFTIHSFQGKTLETGKIFIFLDDMFEYSMLYTALSRAVNFSQLVFVS